MADIFREVDEELRREGLAKLARRYGPAVIGVALAIILGIAGYTAWERYAERQRLERASTYFAALAEMEKDEAAAVQALQELAAGDDGYAALAHLQAATLKAEAGETEDAIAIYRSLAANTGIEPAFRNLATILLAAHTADTAPPEETAAMLEPLTGPADPWRFSALELLALLAVRQDDTDRAAEIYQQLADDLEAPPGLRARATEMLAALQG